MLYLSMNALAAYSSTNTSKLPTPTIHLVVVTVDIFEKRAKNKIKFMLLFI